MAPLSTPSILSTPSPFYCSRFPSSTDRGSSLTRGRRYNYGRWEGFKYSCFHYGAGLLLAQREKRGILFFKNNILLHRSSPAILFQLSFALPAVHDIILYAINPLSADQHFLPRKVLFQEYSKYSAALLRAFQ